jgi:hypothetical protein
MSNRLESDRESRLAQSYSEHNVLTRVQDVRTTRKDGSDNQVRHNLDALPPPSKKQRVGIISLTEVAAAVAVVDCRCPSRCTSRKLATRLCVSPYS